MARTLTRTRIRHYSAAGVQQREDVLAAEEPLEIRVSGVPMAVTMRTPGHDVELVHGFLHAEGVITSAEDVAVARYCDSVDADGRNTYNVLDVQLTGGVQLAPDRVRTVLGTSACGVCGTAAIDAVGQRRRYPLTPGPILSPQTVMELPRTLRQLQPQFAKTGGLHACGLARPAGTIEFAREDIGRHNAMDKVIGAALLAGRVPLVDSVLVTSSRASFELVQKAALAGCAVLVAVSAPSSLAVELARTADLTLVAFTRADGFNVYSGAHRITD
jgi:FdhD protein